MQSQGQSVLGPGNSHVSQWFEKKERPMCPAEKGYEKDQTAQHRPAQEPSALFTAQGQGWKTLRRVLIDEQAHQQECQTNKIAQRNGSRDPELAQDVRKTKQAELVATPMTA